MPNLIRRCLLCLVTGALVGGCGNPAAREQASHLVEGDQEASIKRWKALMQVLFADGEARLDAGDVAGAIERFERVLEVIRCCPYPIDREDWRVRTEEYLTVRHGVFYPPPATPLSARPRPAVAPGSGRELPPAPDFVAGMRHYEAFQYREAAGCFERASAADPDDEVSRHYMLQARLLAGDRGGCVW